MRKIRTIKSHQTMNGVMFESVCRAIPQVVPRPVREVANLLCRLVLKEMRVEMVQDGSAAVAWDGGGRGKNSQHEEEANVRSEW